MIDWIINALWKKKPSAFERTFLYVKKHGLYTQGSTTRIYELLKDLNRTSTEADVDELIRSLNGLKYASNTGGYFHFFFPIVSHILFYKNERAGEILYHLTGPVFADGAGEAMEVIRIIQGAMDLKLKENQYYLTVEGQFWVKNSLPEIEKEVEKEMDKSRKQLNDDGN